MNPNTPKVSAHPATPTLTIAIALIAWPAAIAAQTPKPEDEKVGTLHVAVSSSGKARAIETPKKPRVLEIVPSSAAGQPDWHAEYMKAPTATRSSFAEATLRVAQDSGLNRTKCVEELKAGGDETKPLIKSLDVGRHELLKQLYARAFVIANEELKKQNKSPLKKVLTVNSGGTGDYTRDQDITAFAGDEITEKAFFAGLVKAAGEIGLTPDLKSTGGIDFPQIEVTVFPGGNDLPDSRFGTDMGEFQLDYIKGIQKQLADVEAYIGGGADIEVKGRRRPGQVHVQEFTADPKGGVHYRSETPGNSRETRALFDVQPRERVENWQRASHIFNDLLQGYRHSLHGGDPSKGPLKYSGRAIDYLCAIQGKNPWKRLASDERRVLLKNLFAGSPVPESTLQRMEKVIDVADHVISTKKLPPDCQPEIDQKIALIFLKKAVAASAGEIARQMINPPPFEEGWLRLDERTRWDALTPAERHEEALRRNQTYRENFSNEAMENLVVIMSMLRRIDIEEARQGRAFHGEEAIRQVIETAHPKVRPFLEDASEYARLYMELHDAPTPAHRETTRGHVAEARKTLGKHLQADAPGKLLLDEMERKGPRRYLADDMAGRQPMSVDVAELRSRFNAHLESAFPSIKQEYGDFRQQLATQGAKGYAAEKFKQEFCQLDTAADALQLVEMYQGGASFRDYSRFVATNLLSRVHWSFGHLLAASNVKTAEDAELLGQNLVFSTLARVVPWAATSKVIFDVGKGTVNVTVGYSINVANAALVDALYTGEAGRTNAAADGVEMGKIRGSGFCVLPQAYVVWLVDPDTKQRTLTIDRPEVYRHFMRKWTNTEVENLPETGVRTVPMLKAHDGLVRIFERQAENFDRTWVSSTARKSISLTVTGGEVESALLTFEAVLAAAARAEAGSVIEESGVRSYRSLFDTEDVIQRDLAQRLSSDVLMGMMSYWESFLTAQVLAMREVERTAMQADIAGYAKVVRTAAHEAIVKSPAAPGKGLSYELHAGLQGKRSGDAFDGAQKINVSAYLTGSGPAGEREPPVTIRVRSGKVRMVEKAGSNPNVLEPGDVFEQELVVQAFADDGKGPEVAATKLKARVRMPDDTKPQEVVLRKHVEKNAGGTVRASFTYIEPFKDMPREWPEEDGYILHGKRERFAEGGEPENVAEFQFGVENGVSMTFDNKGRWVTRREVKDGKDHGTSVNRDPDSKARLEIDSNMGTMTELRTYFEEGALNRRLTFELSKKADGEETISGQAESYWSNKKLHWRGQYQTKDVARVLTGRVISERGGTDGGALPGRTGLWEWFYDDGSPKRKGTFKDDVEHGTWADWDETTHARTEVDYDMGRRTATRTYAADGAMGSRTTFEPAAAAATGASVVLGDDEVYWRNGNPRSRGRYRNVGGDRKNVGISETFHENGAPESRFSFDDDGALHGVCQEWFANRRPKSRVTYMKGVRHGLFGEWEEDGARRQGNYANGELHGEYSESDAQGRVIAQGAYANGIRNGAWLEGERGMTCKGTYAAGQKDGRWELYDRSGKNVAWEIYAAGKQTGSGIYKETESASK